MTNVGKPKYSVTEEYHTDGFEPWPRTPKRHVYLYDRVADVIASVLGVAWAVAQLAILGGIGYLIFHFITKYW